VGDKFRDIYILYTYTHIYIYMYIYVYIHIHIYIYIYIYIYVCVCVCVCVCTYVLLFSALISSQVEEVVPNRQMHIDRYREIDVYISCTPTIKRRCAVARSVFM